MLRMHPLFAQLASTVCAEVPAGSEVASLAAGLPGQVHDWHGCCTIVVDWLAAALTPTPGEVPVWREGASAVRAACQLVSCAAKHAWWAVQQAAKASSPSSSGEASSGRDAMSGSTALGETAARAACLPRFLALLATKMAARIAVYAAAHGSEDDERIQR